MEAVSRSRPRIKKTYREVLVVFKNKNTSAILPWKNVLSKLEDGRAEVLYNGQIFEALIIGQSIKFVLLVPNLGPRYRTSSWNNMCMHKLVMPYVRVCVSSDSKASAE